MGYAKYMEDDNEAIEERLYEKDINDYSIVKVEPPMFVCSYCDMSFYSKKGLYEHIKDVHNKVGAIVIVNDKIALNDMYVKNISSLMVIRYDTDLEIFVNEQSVYIDESEINEIDLIPFLERNYINKKEVVIKIGNKKWTIREITKENINIAVIEKIISEWGITTSSGRFVKKENFEYLNSLEKRCLDGFYNYFIACLSNESDKKKRYEEAFGILYEFLHIVPSARFALKIISYKFNWVRLLKQFSIDKDVFYNISKFMLNDSNYEELRKFGNSELFVEDNIEDVINITSDFITGKYESVEKYLSKFTDEMLLKSKDTNFNDKIYLLKARLAIINNNKRLARRCYDEIQSPIFQNEFKEFMKNY